MTPEQHAALIESAKHLAESHRSIAEVKLAGSPTFVQRNLGNLANNTADVLEQCAEALSIMRAEGVGEPLTPLTDEQLRACFHDAWSNDYRLVDQRYLYQLLMAAHGTQTLKADSGTGPFESLRQSANGDSARGTEIRWLGDDSLSYDVRRTGESRDS